MFIKLNKSIISIVFLSSSILCVKSQDKAIETRNILIERKGGEYVETVTAPNHVLQETTKLQERRNYKNDFHFADINSALKIPEVTIGQVADYLGPTKVRKLGSGTVQYGPVVSHRSWYTFLKIQKSRFIFSGRADEVDDKIFRLFLLEAGIKPNQPAIVKQLAYLFLATQGYFEDDGRIIISSIVDLPKDIKQKDSINNLIQPASVKELEGKLFFEIYGWEEPRRQIVKWHFIFEETKFETNRTIVASFPY